MDDAGRCKESAYKEFDSGELFVISSQKTRKIYEKMWKQTRIQNGLTQNEIDVLIFLKQHPHLDTAADIASHCALSRSLVCKSVDTLIKEEYLIVRTDEFDRRYLHLRLTEQAKQIVKELWVKNRQFWDDAFADISNEELEVFQKVLKKVRVNLEKVGTDVTKQ